MKSPSLNHTEQQEMHLTIVRLVGAAFAQITRNLDIGSGELIAAFKEGLLQSAFRDNPRATVAEVSLQTGIDRRHVSEFKKKKSIPGLYKQTRLGLIWQELKWLAQNRYTDGKIPKKGSTHSFESVCKAYANGSYTHTAIYNELCRRKVIRDHGDSISLCQNHLGMIEDKEEYNKIVALLLARLAQSLTLNSRVTENQDKNFIRTVYSSQIPEYKMDALHPLVHKTLQRHFEEINKLLSAHEIDVRPGTFTPYGVSFFEFGRQHILDNLAWDRDDD